MRIIVLTAAASALASLAIADTPTINHGQWESTTTTSVSVDINGQAMDMPGQTLTSSDCVTEEDAQFSPDDFKIEGCAISNFETTSNSASFDLSCDQNGITMDGAMSVEAANGGDSYSGQFDIAGNAPGMGDMTVTGVVSGKRTGACS